LKETAPIWRKIKIVEEEAKTSEKSLNVETIPEKPRCCPRSMRLFREYYDDYRREYGWSRGSTEKVVKELMDTFCLSRSYTFKMIGAVEVAEEMRDFAEQRYGFSPEELLHPSFWYLVGSLPDTEKKREFVEYVVRHNPTFQEAFRAAQMMARKEKPIEDVRTAFDIARKRAEAAADKVRVVLTYDRDYHDDVLERYRVLHLKDTVADWIRWLVDEYVKEHPL